MKRDKLLGYLIIINGIILLCLCAIRFDLAYTMDVFQGLLTFLFFILLSGVVQLIGYLVLRRFKIPMVVWIVLFLSPSLFFTFNDVSFPLTGVKVKHVIRDGRLAQIPESSRNLKVEISGYPGTSFLSFESSPEEIQKFIDNSPCLKGIAPKIYSEGKMHVPSPSNYDGNSKTYVLTPRPSAPEWFKEELRNKGRIYEITPEEHNWGKVIVDDSTNTVYIYVIWD